MDGLRSAQAVHRSDIVPSVHQSRDFSVIPVLKEKALGGVDTHFIIRQCQCQRPAAPRTVSEIGTIPALTVDLGKSADSGADLAEIVSLSQ